MLVDLDLLQRKSSGQLLITCRVQTTTDNKLASSISLLHLWKSLSSETQSRIFGSLRAQGIDFWRTRCFDKDVWERLISENPQELCRNWWHHIRTSEVFRVLSTYPYAMMIAPVFRFLAATWILPPRSITFWIVFLLTSGSFIITIVLLSVTDISALPSKMFEIAIQSVDSVQTRWWWACAFEEFETKHEMLKCWDNLFTFSKNAATNPTNG